MSLSTVSSSLLPISDWKLHCFTTLLNFVATKEDYISLGKDRGVFLLHLKPEGLITFLKTITKTSDRIFLLFGWEILGS